MTTAIAQTELTDREFTLLRDYVYERTGIALAEQKKTLLANRLRRRLRALDLESYQAYYKLLTGGGKAADDEMAQFLVAVTTNETYFFRNPRLWEFVSGDLLRWLVESKAKSPAPQLRFWSAASSSGEEAYTLAITLREKLPTSRDWRIRIVGSDISEKVLDRARQARYAEYAVQKITTAARRRYFKFDKADETYQLRDEFRKLVEFRFHNLRDPFRAGPFEVVFLRNVMMYFDLPMKCRVIDNVRDALVPGGYMIIGDVDPMREGNVLRDHCKLEYVRPSVYRRPIAGAATGPTGLSGR